MVDVIINDQPVSMELDTGSAVTLASEHTHKSKWPETPLQLSSVKLCTYSNESLEVLGQIEAIVQYNEQIVKVPLIVVKGNGQSLYRRDWLSQIRLDWQKIHLKCDIIQVLNHHSHVFKETLGTLQGYEAQLYSTTQL